MQEGQATAHNSELPGASADDAAPAGIWAEVEARFAYLRGLGPNWDSYGGDPIAEQAIADTRHLLEKVFGRFATLPTDRLRPFALASTSDGGIWLEWRYPDRSIAVLVSSGGSLDYLVTDGDGAQRRYQEAEHASVETILDRIGDISPRPPRGV
jgi:hypothetical protein